MAIAFYELMFYQKFKPAPHLLPFVECFYVWECSILYSQSIIIESPPSGFASMVFNYGAAYQVINPKTNTDYLATPKNFMTGQATKSYQLQLQGRIGMVGIVFRPAAVHTIFGLPMYEFTNERLDLRSVLGKEIDILEERLMGEFDHYKKIEILSNYLTVSILKAKKSIDRTDYAANVIVESKGIINITELMDELYVCRRQFERQFLNKVGVSPKYYARVRRIGYLCSELASRKWNVDDWHDLIYQAGYYDQSHFIKEFSAFTGKSPSFYLKNNVELGNFLS